MKDNSKLKLTLLRIALALVVLLLAFMASYNVKSIGAMKLAKDVTEHARVAGWTIDVVCDKDASDKDKTLALAYGVPLEDTETNYYTAKVSNTSETAGKYSIVVSGVPDNVAVKLFKEGTVEPIAAAEISEGKYIFKDIEQLSPGQAGTNLKVEFALNSPATNTSTEKILITFKVDQDHGEA